MKIITLDQWFSAGFASGQKFNIGLKLRQNTAIKLSTSQDCWTLKKHVLTGDSSSQHQGECSSVAKKKNDTPNYT